MIRNFNDLIFHKKTQKRSWLEDAYKTHIIIDALLESAQLGKPVELKKDDFLTSF